MKKYQLNRGVIKGILDLCDDEGVFKKDFQGSLQGLYFSLHCNQVLHRESFL